MSDPMTRKAVLITGATAGIGRATAAQLAHQGAAWISAIRARSSARVLR